MRRLFRSKRTWASVLVVVALVIGGLYFWPNDGPRSIGSGVQVTPTSKLPDGLHAAVDTKTALPFNPDLVDRVSDVFQIGPSGPLGASITFRLPLNQAVSLTDSSYLILVVTSESPDGPWEAITPTSIEGDHIVFQTDHLSWFSAIKIRVGKIVDAVKKAAGKLVNGIAKDVRDVLGLMKALFATLTDDPLADISPPTCANQATAKRDGYWVQVEDSRKTTILWCLGVEGGQHVVKVVNNRRYPLLVNHAGLDVVDPGSLWQLRLPQISRALSGDQTVVFPGEQAVFSANLPEGGGKATLSTQMDGVAQSLYALEVGIRTAFTFFTNFGAGSGVTAPSGQVAGQMPWWFDRADAVLSTADCGKTVFDAKPDAGKVLKECFDSESLHKIFSRYGDKAAKAASLIGKIMPLMPLVSYFRSEFNAMGDQFNGRDHYSLDVVRDGPLPTACPTAGYVCLDSRAGDFDGDGRLDKATLAYYPDAFEVYVFIAFANGKEASGKIMDAKSFNQQFSPQANHLQWVGVSDVDNDGQTEMFAMYYADQRWTIGSLKYVVDGPNRGSLTPLLDAKDLHPLIDGEVAGNGFRCTTAGLEVWQLAQGDQQRQLLIASTYHYDKVGANYVSTDHSESFLGVGNDISTSYARSHRSTGCAGLQPLPSPLSQ